MEKQINQGRLKNFLHYDPETGVFKWKIASARCIKIGDVAGTINNNGYIHIRIRQKPYMAHRLAWLYTYGKFPENHMDHINGLRNDNRIINLRAVTQAENNRNNSVYKNNISGYIGVCWDTEKNRWRVSITGVNYGRFKSKSAAIAKAKEVYKELGFHKNHGKRITANGRAD